MPNKPMRRCQHPGCGKLVSTGYCEQHQPVRRRTESKRWHYLYVSPRFGWQQRRTEQLIREPFCRACAAEGRRTVATDVDHIVPHKGDIRIFMTGELESLCHSCHSRKTMAENAQEFNARAARKR